MRAQPVDLIGGYYADDTLPWSCQDTVNWLPVMAEVAGTRTPKYLKTPPGLKPYQNIGTGPIRGMHDLEGARFVVSGRYLMRISNTGVGIPIGIIPGVGRVSMTHNQFKTGYQLLVENGQGGGGYVYDSTTQTFGRITDPGYPGSISSDYLDSYMLGVEPQGRFWFHSNLADATDYNALDRYEAEASPDKIVGLAASQFEVVVFGQRTTEFFYNVGTATGTFQNRRQAITRGCASRHSIAKLDNTLFWLGDDGIVYRLNGYAALPVSTGPMHRAFAGLNWAEAFAYVWEDRGFKVYYLTFPDGYTWAYDVVSGLWTRSQSFGLKRRRLTHTVKWGNQWFGGDFQDGRIWELDWDYLLEGDEEFISERTSPVLHDNQSSVGIPNAELIFDTGQGPMTEAIPFPVQPTPPEITNNAPDGDNGQAWPAFAYTVAGGNPPFSFSLISGSLPPGIGPLSPTGVIPGGTPTVSGSYSFTVRVTDSEQLWDEVSDSITIANPWYAAGVLGTSGTGRYAYGQAGGANWNNPIRFTGVGTDGEYAIAIAMGSKLVLIPSSGTAAAYTANSGGNWSQVNIVTAQSRNCAVVDRDTFLIGCNGGIILRSADGVTYSAVTVVGTGPRNFLGIASNGATAIAVSDRATLSTDKGLTWSPVGTNYVVANGVVMSCIATSGPLFLSAGQNNRMATSPNGTTWTEVVSPFAGSSNIMVAAYTGGIWVVANGLGQIAYGSAPNGMTVSASTLAGGARSIHAQDGRFVLGSATGVMMSSTDGATWSVLTEPFTGSVASITASP